MHNIDSEVLKKYIEPHFHNELSLESYSIEKHDATKLLTSTRFDIAFKLFYLSMYQKNEALAKEVYQEHIRAFSLGKFIEPGNEDKNSIDKFIEDFHSTLEAIETDGFDENKTLIPLSKNASIANGAHRVASAIFLNKEVSVVALETYDHIYDYQFFYKRNIPLEILEMIATTFVEYASNVHIAFIWPVAQSSDEQIETLIPNIIYKKEMKLNANGAHNLLSQIYYGEEWLGSVENDFSGSKGKLVECFKNFDAVKVVAFQAENLEKVLEIKEQIRQAFNVGKHSIHITDTKEEAMRTAHIVFNANSIHFLNHAKPNRYLSTHKKIDKFKMFIAKNNLPFDEVLIDSSMVLSIYGLREAKDIDYLCSNQQKINILVENINAHDEALVYYGKNKNELLYDPKNYFYFNDIKFISFSQLYHMKSHRAEQKDKNDRKMMEALIENNQFKSLVNQYRQKLFYAQILLRQKIVDLLQKLGIFNGTRKIYQKIKGFDA